MNTYLVIDIGGSAIKYALLDEQSTITEKHSIPTPMDSLENFINTIGTIYDTYAHCIKGMAISMPGILDPHTGFCYTGGALRYINNINMIDLLKERCPINITIGNDAKCAAHAELGFGSLQDVKDGAVIILGTGIGGCLIKDGAIHYGKHFLAGEFSFMNTNVQHPFSHQWMWAFRNGSRGLLQRVQEHCQTSEKYTGEEIFDMANDDDLVYEAINQFTLEIAVQIYNLHLLFDCDKVAIGGGISVQPLLLQLIQENLNKIYDAVRFPMPRPLVVGCQFCNDANLIGALHQHLLTFA